MYIVLVIVLSFYAKYSGCTKVSISSHEKGEYIHFNNMMERQWDLDCNYDVHNTFVEHCISSESVLLKIKDCLNNKYQSVTQTLEEYVTERIDEIHTIHREVGEERAILETMKRELEKRSCLLEKKEKELKERQSRLRRDRDYYNTKHRKEKVEICRQWQQLKDEISRMEEMHELQKVCSI